MCNTKIKSLVVDSDFFNQKYNIIEDKNVFT